MTAWLGFLKKEWTESVKSYKLLLVVVIFSILGVLNPFTAKIMPVLMESILPEGAVMDFPEPTALDSWMQFYSNLSQMGLIVFIILFSALVSKELERGTLVILLTKGLRRSTVITTKWAIGVLYWTLGFLLTFGITYLYTTYYWDQSIIEHMPFAMTCVYVFGVLMFTVTLWGNTVFASMYGGLLTTAVVVIGLFIASIFPASASWNPVQLLTASAELLTGAAAVHEFTIPLLISVAAIGLLLAAAIAQFNKKIV